MHEPVIHVADPLKTGFKQRLWYILYFFIFIILYYIIIIIIILFFSFVRVFVYFVYDFNVK